MWGLEWTGLNCPEARSSNRLRRSAARARTRLLCTTLALTLASMASAAGARAGSETVDISGSELGRWLKTRAGPELAKQFASMPRLKGQPAVLRELRDGQPGAPSSALSAAIAEQLRRTLVAVPGMQLRWRQGSGALCGQSSELVIGYSLARSGRELEVRIDVIDPTEGVWVAGVGGRWQGALTGGEQKALTRRQAAAPTGTLAAPLSEGDDALIVAQLDEQFRCGWGQPGQFRGTVGAAQRAPSAGSTDPRAAQRARLLSQLMTRLAQWPGITVVATAEADWRVSLLERVAGNGVAQLVVQADQSSAEGGATPSAPRTVASVFVRRAARGPVNTSASERVATAPRVPAARVSRPAATRSHRVGTTVAGPEPLPLLSALRVSDARVQRINGAANPCQQARPGSGAGCYEVATVLGAPGYLVSFLVSERAGAGLPAIEPITCGTPPKSRPAGPIRFRIDLGASPGVAFYAVATTDAALAKRLAALLYQAPGACRDEGRFAAAGEWLQALDRMVVVAAPTEELARVVRWRQVHIGSSKAFRQTPVRATARR